MERNKVLMGIITNYLLNQEGEKLKVEEAIHLIKDELLHETNGKAIRDAVEEASLPGLSNEVKTSRTNKIMEPTYWAIDQYKALIEKENAIKLELLHSYYDIQAFYMRIDNLFYCLNFKKRQVVRLLLIHDMTKDVGKKELKCGHEVLQKLIDECMDFLLENVDDILKNKVIAAFDFTKIFHTNHILQEKI